MDLYTKAVLTIIAAALSAIALQNAGAVPAFAQSAKGPVAVSICDSLGRCGLGAGNLPVLVAVMKD